MEVIDEEPNLVAYEAWSPIPQDMVLSYLKNGVPSPINLLLHWSAPAFKYSVPRDTVFVDPRIGLNDICLNTIEVCGCLSIAKGN